MSQLRARNGSKLRAGQGSQLRAYGLGFKTFTEELEDIVEMEWTAEVYQYNVTQNTTSSKGKVNIIFGPYFGLALLGPPGRYAGKNEQGVGIGRAYNGAPDPANDTVSSPTSMTYPNDINAHQFSFNSWSAVGSLPLTPFWENTGTSMIFRGEIQMLGITFDPYTSTPRGTFLYGHPQFLSFTGSNWVKSTTLEFITMYFDGLPSFSIGFPSGQDQLRCLIRVQCEVTA
jgi:hypothetical protein